MKRDLLVSTIGFMQNGNVIEVVASAQKSDVDSFMVAETSKELSQVIASLSELSKQDIINFGILKKALALSGLETNPRAIDAIRNFFELYTYQRVNIQPVDSFSKIKKAVARYGSEKDKLDFGRLESSISGNSDFLTSVISMGLFETEKPKVKELVDNCYLK